MVSEYIYRQIMDQAEYNYNTKEWELPGKCFKEFEADSTLYFSSKHELSKFVYNQLERE